MDSQTIRHTVDLIVQLLDTTTGRAIDVRDVSFTKDGEPFTVMRKGDGNFISINSGREDFSLGIRVKGYEEDTVQVVYDKLDNVMPVLAVYLVPGNGIQPGAPLLTFTGRLQGITSIEGVCVDDVCCSIQTFDERKRIMQVYTSKGQMRMHHLDYGLVASDGSSYEGFQIKKEISSNSVKIKKPLENSFFVNQSICRVVYGKVYDDGTYLLRARDDRSELNFIIRYEVGGESRFMKVDFHALEGMELT